MAQRHVYSYDASERPRAADTESAGDRLCGRGEWCAEATRELTADGKMERKPASCHRAFCESDWAIIGQCLRDLPETYARLCWHLGEHVTREVMVRVPFGPSVPIRLDVDEIMRLIVDAVMTWHERTADAVPGRLAVLSTRVWREDSLGPHAGHRLARCCQVLSGHLTTLLGLDPEPMVRPSCSPAAKAVYGAVVGQAVADTTLALAGGVQAGNELMRLDYLARAAMGETPAQVVRFLGVVCANPSCSRMALRMADPPQHDGDTAYWSQCQACRHLMSEQEYVNWARRNARYWAGRLTPAQIASRSDLDVGTVARLAEVTRGALVAG